MISKKKKKRKDLSNLVFFTFLLIVVILIGGVLIHKNITIFQQRFSLSEKKESLEQEVFLLEEEQEFLEEGLSEERWDYFIEKEARERLNLKKEGESVVSFVLPEIEEEKEEEEISLSWWDRIKNIFRW